MHHIICKQVLDVRFGHGIEKFRTQQLISDYFKDTILPALERSFDKVAQQDEAVYLDHLDIDLGFLSLREIEARTNKAKLERILREHCSLLFTRSNGAALKVVPVMRNFFGQWLFFLEKGYLPWNADDSLDAILDKVKSQLGDKALVRRLRDTLLKYPVAVDRLIYQHRDGFLLDLLSGMQPAEELQLTQIVQAYRWFMQKLSRIDQGKYIRDNDVVRHRIWKQLLLDGIHHKPPVMDEILRILVIEGTRSLTVPLLNRINGVSGNVFGGILTRMKKIIEEGVTDVQDPIEKEVRKTDDASRKQPDKEGIFVQHAGLVLLHPFLKPLFVDLGWLKSDRFRNEKFRQQALYLLHYLATGEEDPGEDMLLIPKLLCDYPLEEVVAMKPKHSNSLKKKADELLRTVIARWTILKKTSPATLQQQFLQRKGKLFTRNEKVYLQVEISSIDILLDKLPWGLNLIKLPWKKDIIWVEWR